MNSSDKTNPVKKILLTLIVVIVVTVLALNCFTIVAAGTSKVQSTFGRVNPVHYGEGFHIPVNPFSSFDTFDTRNQRYEVNNLNIPTQDRFNSTGNVTVLYRIDDARTPYIKQNYGSATEFIDKTLRQHLRSIIRDEGRRITDSRGLAQSGNVTAMQESARHRLADALSETGIEIQEVLVQDITFDPRIADQILQTQQRIQREEAEASQLRIIETQAQQVAAEAAGTANAAREQADAEAYKVQEQAKAEAAAILAKAEAERDAMIAIADGNRALDASLTQPVLRKQELDNEAILFQRSQGNVPHTIIGETNLRAYGMPLLNQSK